MLGDVLDGKTSEQAARDQYGVVVSDGEVDLPATESLRARLCADRGAINWIYDRGQLGRER